MRPPDRSNRTPPQRRQPARLRFEVPEALDDHLLRLLRYRSETGFRHPVDWDAFVVPIDVLIDGENLTERLPPEPVFDVVASLATLAEHVVATGVVGRLEFRNSPWTLAARRVSPNEVLVETAHFEERRFSARSYRMPLRELPAAALRLLDELDARLSGARDAAGLAGLTSPLERLREPLRDAIAQLDDARPGQQSDPRATVVVETRSSEGYTLQSTVAMPSGGSPETGDAGQPDLLPGAFAWVPDSAAGVVLRGNPVAALTGFVAALLHRMEDPALRHAPLALRCGQGTIEWHSHDRLLRSPGTTLHDEWQLAADPVAAVMALLEHTVQLADELRLRLAPTMREARDALGALRDDAEVLRRRMVLAQPAPRSAIAAPPRAVPDAAGPRTARAPTPGQIRHVRVEWAPPRALRTRNHVEAWPTDAGWVVREGPTLWGADAAGEVRWAHESSALPASLRHVVTERAVFTAVRSRGDGSATWPDCVAWVTDESGTEVARATMPDTAIRGIAPVSSDSGTWGGVVADRRLGLLATDGAWEVLDVPVRRPRLARVGARVVVAEAGAPGIVAAWQPGALRPVWEWVVDADRIELSVLGDHVVAWASRHREMDSVVALLDAATGAVLALIREPLAPLARGTLDDGRPYQVLGVRRPERVVFPSEDFSELTSVDVDAACLPGGDPGGFCTAGLLVLAGEGEVVALDPRDPSRRVWTAALDVDRSVLRGVVFPERADLLVLPTNDSVHWLTATDGRVVASLARRDDVLVSAFASGSGDLLCVESEDGGTRIVVARVLASLRLLRGGRGGDDWAAG